MTGSGGLMASVVPVLAVLAIVLTSLRLPGVWLLVAAGLVSQFILGGERSDWIWLAAFIVLAMMVQLSGNLVPLRWRGSSRGDRKIGMGVMLGAVLGGAVCVQLPLWILLMALALLGLAGGMFVEYRRRRAVIEDDDGEDDDLAPTLAALPMLRRVFLVWLRVGITTGMAFWLVRHLYFTPAMS